METPDTMKFSLRLKRFIPEVRRYVTICLGWTVIATILSGGRNLEALGQPLIVVLAVYLVGGTLVGLLAAALLPFATSSLRAWIVGFIVGVPTAFMILAVFRPNAQPLATVIATLITAAVLGGSYGVIGWKSGFDN